MTTTTAPTQRNTTHKVLWAAQILIGLFMIFASGMPKLLGAAAAAEVFDQIGWGSWFQYFTGAVEVAGGVGLLIPRLAGLAALGLVGVMIGAVITQLTVLDQPALAIMPAVLGVVLALVARHRWTQTKELVTGLHR
jgi:putative oxidoreductase